MKNLLKSIIRCTSCYGSSFEFRRERVVCNTCETVYRAIEGIPVFHDDVSVDRVLTREIYSHPIPQHIKEVLSPGAQKISLHLGSGYRPKAPENVIDCDYILFPNTDVGVDAHNLPFKNNSFHSIVSLNVFEHLYDPSAAANEMLRVLVPGGKLLLRTAFLQPLHMEPNHYYNTTEYGIRKWFSSFEIEYIVVSDNFSPGLTIGWIVDEIVRNLPKHCTKDEMQSIWSSSVKDWVEIWRNPAGDKKGLLSLVNRLDQSVKKRISLGFEMTASKPF